MPPLSLIDLSRIDTDTIAYDRKYIYQRMPHRYEFEVLDGVFFVDREDRIAAGYHDCREDEWWVRGHIPGKPIFPGVLQIEAAAQLIAFMSRYVDGCDSFVAFGGVENCRFRGAVIPPTRFLVLAELIEDRPRRVTGNAQGIVDGKVVFEARIAGMAMPGPD